MSVLPRVTELTRERISREFDDLGPDACMAEIQADLRQHNPELLDMASRWAAGGEASSLMTAFGMFYRLLAAEARAPLDSSSLYPLPRVSVEVRDAIVTDTAITERQKQVLLDIYTSFVQQNEAAREETAPA